MLSKLHLNYRNNTFIKKGNNELNGKNFNIDNHPEFRKYVDGLLSEFKRGVEAIVVNGVDGQWNMSVEKVVSVIHKAYDNIQIIDKVTAIIYDPQASALEQFKNKIINGLKLSDRVLKYTNQLQSEIEQNLFAGLSEGK